MSKKEENPLMDWAKIIIKDSPKLSEPNKIGTETGRCQTTEENISAEPNHHTVSCLPDVGTAVIREAVNTYSKQTETAYVVAEYRKVGNPFGGFDSELKSIVANSLTSKRDLAEDRASYLCKNSCNSEMTFFAVMKLTSDY